MCVELGSVPSDAPGLGFLPKGVPGELETDLGQGMEGQDSGNGFPQRAGLDGMLESSQGESVPLFYTHIIKNLSLHPV